MNERKCLKLAWTPLLTFLLISCSDSTGPEPVRFETTISVVSENEVSGSPQLEVVARDGTVDIRGWIETPGTCGRERITAEHLDGDIDITFSLGDPPEPGSFPIGCTTLPVYWIYIVTPVNLPSGNYRTHVSADFTLIGEGSVVIGKESFEIP